MATVFDPDAYLEKAFDPDAYLGEEAAPEAQPEQGTTLFQRTGEDVKKRQERVKEGVRKFVRDEETGVELAGDIIGQSAGLYLDVLGEYIVTGAKTLAEQANPKVKEFVTVGFESFKNLIPPEVKDALTEGLGSGIETYQELEQAYPRTMRQVENVANTVFALAPVKTGDISAKPTTLLKTANTLTKRAKKKSFTTRKESLIEMVRPRTFVNTEEGAKESLRTKLTGVFRSKKITPTADEEIIAKTVARVPGIDPVKSFTHNQNVVTEAANATGATLERQLKGIATTVQKGPQKNILSEASNAIDETVNTLVTRNIMLREGMTDAKDIARAAKSILAQSDNSAYGVHKARQELDTLVKSWGKQFTDKKGTFEIANREIRDTLNKVVDKNAKSVKSKLLRDRHHRLLQAQGVLAQKAKAEGANVITRHLSNLTELFGARSKILSGSAILLGTTQLGASQIVAAPVGAAIGAYVLGKGLQQMWGSPGFKKGLASMLKATDTGIKAAKSNQMRAQLRSDRVAILEIMKSMDVADPTEELKAALQ